MMELRSWALWAAIALGALACGNGEKANGPAGKVTAVEGQVSATRGSDAPRPLALGAIVYADDLIQTTKGSEVTITLTKNNAPLTLSDGASRKIVESAAWRAPASVAGDKLAGKVNDESMTAGRSGDKEAGDDPSTAMANTQSATRDYAKQDVDRPEVKASQQLPASKGKKKIGGEKRHKRPISDGKPGGDSDSLIGSVGGSGGADKGTKSGGGGGGSTSDNAKSGGKQPEPRKTAKSDEAKNELEAASQIEPAKNGSLRLRSAKPSKKRDALARAVSRRSRWIGTCLVDVKGEVVINATVMLGAKAPIESLKFSKGKPPSKAIACVRRALETRFDATFDATRIVVRGNYK